MHRLAAIAGGWEAGSSPEGVIFIEQTTAPLVVLTAADTDIQVFAKAIRQLPSPFSAVRIANLLQLQQQLTIDTYAETVLTSAKGIILRILGGRAYWSYGLEVVRELVENTGATLIVLPGDDRPDLELMSHSTIPLGKVEQFWRYFLEGGVANYGRALQSLQALCTEEDLVIESAQVVPRVGLYPWSTPVASKLSESLGRAGILFYRAHYLSGNTDAINALCQSLWSRGLEPVPIFVGSLQDPEQQVQVLKLLQSKGPLETLQGHYTSPLNPPFLSPRQGDTLGDFEDLRLPGMGNAEINGAVQTDSENGLEVLINTLSFSLAKIGAAELNLDLWQTLNIPILQAICSGGSMERWQSQTLALSPRDMAMNVVLPEVDGRIMGRAISFKGTQRYDEALETDVMNYQPVGDRIDFMASLATNWAKLRRTPPSQRNIALILANYPTRDGRLANGVGLDTPESCVRILQVLQDAGYQLSTFPQTGDDLIQWLTTGVTNDPESRELRKIYQQVSRADYEVFFQSLPSPVQQAVCDRWGTPSQAAPEGFFSIAGLQLGHIFVGIQPARGYDLDPSLNYHAPDLEPPHAYLAFYYWVRLQFGAHAVVHVGKHGNLEWLPGKSVALSEHCFPEVALGPMPHLYPFIVNDPGEGAQAKRRSQAVIIDHLTPPLTRAELYGPLQHLEALIDEYYEAQTLDPTRLPVIRDHISALVKESQLYRDLGMEWSQQVQVAELEAFLSQADGYLCELKETQIRDGLHILGQCPEGTQLRDLLIALARYPGAGLVGLTQAIALDWQLSFDPIAADFSTPLSDLDINRLPTQLTAGSPVVPCRIVGDAVALLEQQATLWVEDLLNQGPIPPNMPQTQEVLQWISDCLLPALCQTDQELTHLLKGLNGQYVPSGPSGAPTRGRPDVLPTGRNFYSVDIRSLPTESAWDVGRKAAEALVERYTQEQGEYPQTLGLSMWGTATMRTGGDDMAEALALLGVRPVWEGASRRVIDFEILPLSLLGRPRVDVTLRISGFFRDAFSNLIDLFDQAVQAVARLDESPGQNPLAARVKTEVSAWLAQGIPKIEAERRSQYRIFGSKPGAYGAGLQGVIEAQNWQTDEDLARAYIQWSCYAYTAQATEQWTTATETEDCSGTYAPEAFEQRLTDLQIVLHNQDNREHDLLDSDDYYQFQGGLAAAVRSRQGQNPQIYFGDHSRPARPQIRTLTEELARVYRSRVANPKWIAGVMRHGYKGAFEMAATVDYMFAYDATTHCVEDHMYQGVAEAYVLDPQVQAFVQTKNPWALRDMAERLLEAHQRGLWSAASPEIVDELRSLVHQAEGAIEGLSK